MKIIDDAIVDNCPEVESYWGKNMKKSLLVKQSLRQSPKQSLGRGATGPSVQQSPK